MSQYAAGRRFEWRVRDHLIGNGYEAWRAAGSKGPADLVCFKPGQVLFISCKNHPGALPPAERAALLKAAAMIGAVPLHAFRPPRARGLVYREITGQAPDAWRPWSPDELGAA